MQQRVTPDASAPVLFGRINSMKRRDFIKTTAVAAAGTAIAMPAIAQSAPEVKWRMTSSFPKSLDTLFGGAETFCKFVAEATDNKFQIQPFAAGEIVPGLQALDATQNGTVEMCQTALYYYWGKDPTFCFGAAVPFGLNTRQQNAWFYQAGGNELMNEFMAAYKVMGYPGGNTGTQMGGWFRKEIKNVDDMKGLKMRIAGLAGAVMSKVGVVPQQVAGGDIYPSLEKGTIDAAEWVGPYDDEKLGFNKVAPFYYYPGWWEGGTSLHYLFSVEKFNALPKAYQAILKAACAQSNQEITGRYDARNPAALKRLVQGGTQLRPFPNDVMEACYKASVETNNELSAKNPAFKKVHDAHMAFRGDEYLWWQVAELGFDNFMIRQRAKGF
jgi:TRAP-type mannitol/chloroaromatic compound transport system substrate-binding protein